mmetsp:Transcript_66455/g.105069  ORF Transcript_66455/g.105069 Transcript_66455/m.105069 type:complete len:715 (-) Transcript_66455:145-2289(-)|eukprot:CAMPEP_0169193438 /NCGR_PEP_ID=MMETSP1016-20121227/6171_1 /TAXON_ID=342587 /ORGANISM="Karlodinium micrum, Strain CCMP2283" /LENGTH=714 /DNA_ID=CAMNT_0009269891 /DNA_START=83 /DNA_END=2227 /DNA_ORIENTATION=+
MVLSFGLLAGASAAGFYNWASSIYTYNRDAWMTDMQLDQANTFHEDSLRIDMKNMDREEVRDLMLSDINKINNVILVTTLILSLAGEMLFEGEVPDDVAGYVLNAYMLCLGSAIFHLVLSILFGMYASNEAYAASARMLTSEIRPLWKAHFSKLKGRRGKEMTKSFDQKPMGSIFMPPLASRVRNAIQGRRASANDTKPDLELSGTALSDPDVHPDWANDINDGYRDAWRSLGESEWHHFKKYSMQCAAFGTKNLLEACGYLCIARLYGNHRDAWAFWAVQIIFVSLNVIVMQFLLSTRSCFKGIIVATGPFSCAIAATTSFEIVDRICVPLCYLSHVAITTFLLQNPTWRESEEQQKEESALPLEKTYYFRSTADTASADDDLEVCPNQSNLEQPQISPARQISPRSSAGNIPRVMLVRGLCVLTILWGSAFVWALYGAIWGMNFKNEMAMIPQWTVGPKVADFSTVPIRLPSPYFEPHSIVCPRDLVFLADKYRVFELHDGDKGVQPYRCDVNGTIADLASTCDEHSCWPVVLLHGDPPTVVDCSTGKQRTLLQTPVGVDRFATTGDGILYASNHGLVVQYQLQKHRSGWAPFWDITNVQSGLRAIDVVEHRLLLFTNIATVEAINLETGESCGTWAMPGTLMGAGCGMQGSDSILVLARQSESEGSRPKGVSPVNVMWARLPGAEEQCGRTGDGQNATRNMSLMFPQFATV